MKRCIYCGATAMEDDKFCPKCGKAFDDIKDDADFFTANNEKKSSNNENVFTSNDAQPSDDNSAVGLSIICYIWWLVLIPIIMNRKEKFIRYHVNQGLILAIFSTAIAIIAPILSILPGIGPVLTILVIAVAEIFSFCLTVIGIVNVAQRKTKELPLIGRYNIYS